MTNKTPGYRLKANANYEAKVIQKTLRFKLVEDADLLAAIKLDKAPFNQLVKDLLRQHYEVKK